MTHRVIIACAAFLLVWTASAEAQHHGAKAAKQTASESTDSTSYVCPMHPKVTSTKPGECPECGMDLVEQKVVGAKQGATKTVDAGYVCPMHPKVTSSKPGECPECGMDLVKQKSKSAVHKAAGPKMKGDKSTCGCCADCQNCSKHGGRAGDHSKSAGSDSTKHH